MTAYRLARMPSKSSLIKLFRVFRVRSPKLSCQAHPDLFYALDRACIFMRKECDDWVCREWVCTGLQRKPPLPEDEDRPWVLYLHLPFEGTKETVCTWESWHPERVTCTLKGMGCRGNTGNWVQPLIAIQAQGLNQPREYAVFLFSFPSSLQHWESLENMKPFFPSWLLSLGYMYPSVSLLLSCRFMYLWAFSFCHLSLSNIHNWIGLFFSWQIRSFFPG